MHKVNTKQGMSRTWHAGTCSALNAVAQASDTATAAAGAAAAAIAAGECATSSFVAAAASAAAAAAAYVHQSPLRSLGLAERLPNYNT